jgi:hypothetical protein
MSEETWIVVFTNQEECLQWKQALGLSSGESDKGVVIDAISSRFSECAPSRRNPDLPGRSNRVGC